jgi:hypothetical protein
MSYEAAIKKAWDEPGKLTDKAIFQISLLNDTYDIDLKNRKVVSVSRKTPPKDFITILLLHYLAGTLKNGFCPSGEWISFKEIEGGAFYYPAFREAAIEPILKKYGSTPQNLPEALKRFKGSKIGEGDIAIELETFDKMNVRIILWKGDEEFAPEATIMFDKNLADIFSTEDIVVLLRMVAHSL